MLMVLSILLPMLGATVLLGFEDDKQRRTATSAIVLVSVLLAFCFVFFIFLLFFNL